MHLGSCNLCIGFSVQEDPIKVWVLILESHMANLFFCTSECYHTVICLRTVNVLYLYFSFLMMVLIIETGLLVSEYQQLQIFKLYTIFSRLTS